MLAGQALASSGFQRLTSSFSVETSQVAVVKMRFQRRHQRAIKRRSGKSSCRTSARRGTMLAQKRQHLLLYGGFVQRRGLDLVDQTRRPWVILFQSSMPSSTASD